MWLEGKQLRARIDWLLPYTLSTWIAGNTAVHAQALVGVSRIVTHTRALDALAQPMLLPLTMFNCVKLHLF